MISNSFFQSFLIHLEELRSRLIKAAGAFILAMCLCYNFVGPLIPFLTAPAGHLYFTSPGEAFWAYMMLDMVLAFVISSPYIFYQIWAYVGEALKPSEKKFVKVFFPLSVVFFLAGGAFAYFVSVPMAYRFLMSFSSSYLVPMVTVKNYLGFVAHMILAFGVAFELPLILAFLAAIGIASAEFLRQKRRHAVIGILVAAALLTPPDIASMMILALPLMLLYELGIFFVKIFYKQPSVIEVSIK